MQDANDSADSNTARYGQNQEKEENCDYWIEFIPFDNFLTENNKVLKA